MNILVFSDSHGATKEMHAAIARHQPSYVIHLGDFLRDGQGLARAYPKLPLILVPGNCDGWTDQPLKRQVVLGGVSILLSHGHVWGVKRGFEAALADARATSADVVLFGHTHRPFCQREWDGLWVMNPGAIPKSYGMIAVQNGCAVCTLHRPQ